MLRMVLNYEAEVRGQGRDKCSLCRGSRTVTGPSRLLRGSHRAHANVGRRKQRYSRDGGADDGCYFPWAPHAGILSLSRRGPWSTPALCCAATRHEAGSAVLAKVVRNEQIFPH